MGHDKNTGPSYVGFVMDEIGAMARKGKDGIEVVQRKRFIDADAVSVGGRWYPVRLDWSMEDDIMVRHSGFPEQLDFSCQNLETGVRWILPNYERTDK